MNVTEQQHRKKKNQVFLLHADQMFCSSVNPGPRLPNDFLGFRKPKDGSVPAELTAIPDEPPRVLLWSGAGD